MRTPAGQASAAVYFVDSLPAQTSEFSDQILQLLPAAHPGSPPHINHPPADSQAPGDHAVAVGQMSMKLLTQA